MGSQALVGIPVVAALREDPNLSRHSSIWPFETGMSWGRRPAGSGGSKRWIVYAEVWPSLAQVDRDTHPVPDAAQVIGMSGLLAWRDKLGGLDQLFAPQLGPTDEKTVLEEGWVLMATSEGLDDWI